MNHILLHPLQTKVNKSITIPGCIGYTIRALNIAAMTKGSVKILNPLKSDDTYSMVNALKTLGISVDEGEDYFLVHGGVNQIKNAEYNINIGLSGRAARTLLALLCVVPGNKILTCNEEFKKRPVGDLVDGLRQIGAKIDYLEKKNHLPVKISQSIIRPGEISMNGSLSSQYFSAMMMIAPLIGNMTINVEGHQSSKPYIDMTINIMKNFGVNVTNNNYAQYIIGSNQKYTNIKTYSVEPEATSSSYFFAIAAITQSRIRTPGLSPNSLQGDLQFIDILKKMGCSMVKNIDENWIEVSGSKKLTGITVDMNNTPDLVPTLAVIAAFADGTTTITNIAHARIKESDRIESPKIELEKMGVKVESTINSLTIHGGNAHGTTIDTYGDHRMAMAFAVAGARIPGIVINNPNVVSKSFPDFWNKLEEIGVKTERNSNL